MDLLPVPLAALIPAGILAYIIAGVIYRLYFHPLSKFPGPKLAAITHLYEFYFNLVKGGMFIWEIERMHQQYGPIVRITPHELHIKDPQFYDEIYAPSSRKREKYVGFVAHFGTPQSMVTTINHDHHRLRRGLLNSYFSKRSVMRLEPLIQENIDKLSKRFGAAGKSGAIIRLDAAFTALTMDIITHYSYGKSYNYLDEDDFKLSWKEAVLEASANGAMLRHFPFVLTISKSMPPWLLKKLDPQAAVLLEIQHMVRKQSLESLESFEKAENKGSQATAFDALCDPSLPPEERSIDRLQDEGQILLAAGSETTAKTLTTIAFYLLSNKALLSKLREELKKVMPTPLSTASWTELEHLPYLGAVINEGLRLSYGVTTRLPRVAPTEALRYKDWVIPPGTPVSESSYFVHMDPSIFPDPGSFDPERWIRAAEKGERLDRFIVSFTKGSRQCLGINLAYAELFLTVAGIFRRFDMELHETTVDDVRLVRDRFFGASRDGSMGVRASISGTVDS
ncbi:benzoate 4-monooxygenase cytochrome P450, putative [Paecilomyces variotii No. 5]|uniref:Benzoate 4-monooxygenase cytochrome P450, putative n=1 Tax=Byssochlamys spectabilis (strain No. 5 / NBRC 109023) TaxID=1356009 RepID=V5HVY2_BYSSN|nr:benzoate 4-monooxygenase cytochrome P450, putative [Paecilomyces variotii No. 5]